jgi:hypothetical protein
MGMKTRYFSTRAATIESANKKKLYGSVGFQSWFLIHVIRDDQCCGTVTIYYGSGSDF